MSLDFGFSKALLLRWASGAANTILLTGRGHGTTTARELLAKMATRDAAAASKAAARAAAARTGGARMAGGVGGGASRYGAVGAGGGGGGGGGMHGHDDDDVDEEEEEEAPLFVGVKVRQAGEEGRGGEQGSIYM